MLHFICSATMASLPWSNAKKKATYARMLMITEYDVYDPITGALKITNIMLLHGIELIWLVGQISLTIMIACRNQ